MSLIVPFILISWIAVMALVTRFSDAAPAAGMTAKLYDAGAWLVLPAGLTGCLPLTRAQRARLL